MEDFDGGICENGDGVTVSVLNSDLNHVHAETSFVPAGYNVAT